MTVSIKRTILHWRIGDKLLAISRSGGITYCSAAGRDDRCTDAALAARPQQQRVRPRDCDWRGSFRQVAHVIARLVRVLLSAR
jgi:hypothetical protein